MIQGKEREVKEFNRYVGVAEFNVVGFNLTKDQIQKQFGYEPKQEMSYTGVSKEGNDTVNITVFLKEKTTGEAARATYFLENKLRVAQDGKPQYINNKAMSSYVIEGQEWFTKNEYRQAYVGEAELVNFIKNWLSNFDWFSDPDVTLDLNQTKEFLKGNVKVLNEMAQKYNKQTIGYLSGIRSYDGKDYQDIYNRACLPGYSVKKIQDLSKGSTEEELSKYPYGVRQFVKQVEGQYGYSNYFGNSYKYRVYDPSENKLTSGGSGLLNKTVSDINF